MRPSGEGGKSQKFLQGGVKKIFPPPWAWLAHVCHLTFRISVLLNLLNIWKNKWIKNLQGYFVVKIGSNLLRLSKLAWYLVQFLILILWHPHFLKVSCKIVIFWCSFSVKIRCTTWEFFLKVFIRLLHWNSAFLVPCFQCKNVFLFVLC